MTDKQPEALSIAKRLKDQQQPLSLALRHKAAAELRRLHEVNAELVEALNYFMLSVENSSHLDARIGFISGAFDRARAAIAKATGEQQ